MYCIIGLIIKDLDWINMDNEVNNKPNGADDNPAISAVQTTDISSTQPQTNSQKSSKSYLVFSIICIFIFIFIALIDMDKLGLFSSFSYLFNTVLILSLFVSGNILAYIIFTGMRWKKWKIISKLSLILMYFSPLLIFAGCHLRVLINQAATKEMGGEIFTGIMTILTLGDAKIAKLYVNEMQKYNSLSNSLVYGGYIIAITCIAVLIFTIVSNKRKNSIN